MFSTAWLVSPKKNCHVDLLREILREILLDLLVHLLNLDPESAD